MRQRLESFRTLGPVVVLLALMLGCESSPAEPRSDGVAMLLFRSGFEPGTRLDVIGGTHVLAGTDLVTGFSWDRDLPAERGHFIYNGANPREQYVTTSIIDGTLLQEVKADFPDGANSLTRNQYSLVNPGTQGYIRYRMKLQEDFLAAWPAENAWRIVMEWKEPDPSGPGDGASNYRFNLQIRRHPEQRDVPVWLLQGQVVHPVRRDDWYASYGVPVPIGRWFDLEVFWRYGGETQGRVWVAVDGVVVAEYEGRTQHPDNPMGVYHWDIFKNYSDVETWAAPTRQWIDNVEIWSAVPQGASRR